MRCADCRDAVNAFVDGELLAEEQRDVREHLATCADCRREHEVLVATSRTLKEGLVRHRAPDVLKARIRSALAQPDAFAPAASPPRRSWMRLVAAGIVIAAASSGLTVAAIHNPFTQQNATSDVLASHIRSLMPGHLVDIASTDQHNVKPWFNGRVNLSPTVPRLDSAGFTLTGGRIDYIEGRATAAIVYMRREHVINVFAWAEPGHDIQATPGMKNGYHFIWERRDGVETWIVSDLNVAELAEFATRYAAAR